MSSPWWRRQLADLGHTLVSLFVIGWFIVFGSMIVFRWEDMMSKLASFRPGSTQDNCGALKEELKADVLCKVSDDCKFTRGELDAYRERVQQYNEHCEPDQPLTIGR